MKRELKTWICGFRPPLLPSCGAALLLSAAAIFVVAADSAKALPDALVYMVYVCAAASLSLAVWAIVRAVRSGDPKARLRAAAHKLPLTGRLADDYSFRTVTFAYASFGTNALFAVSKGIAGWFSSSAWLITFAAYYLILCIAKLLLLQSSRKLGRIADGKQRLTREWRAYRTCGVLLMLLTIVMQGAVVLIMTKGSGFTYYGVLILVVAMYDFYCLISSIVYMVRTRKKHSPIIVAIKSISFATSLVSMLSLQTAMFAAYGQGAETAKQSTMNLLAGSAVCLILLALGLIMVIKSSRIIKAIRGEEQL